jgi:hypothetical protein
MSHDVPYFVPRTALTYKISCIRVIWSESPAITSDHQRDDAKYLRDKAKECHCMAMAATDPRIAKRRAIGAGSSGKGLKPRSHEITTPSTFGSVIVPHGVV